MTWTLGAETVTSLVRGDWENAKRYGSVLAEGIVKGCARRDGGAGAGHGDADGAADEHAHAHSHGSRRHGGGGGPPADGDAASYEGRR